MSHLRRPNPNDPRDIGDYVDARLDDMERRRVDHILPHSQPLTGTDVARALFPAHGTVKATGCSVAWSDTELAPLVPMAITGGAA